LATQFLAESSVNPLAQAQLGRALFDPEQVTHLNAKSTQVAHYDSQVPQAYPSPLSKYPFKQAHNLLGSLVE